MIDANTRWKDSGFDCDHCGGVIHKRTDQENRSADDISFQCQECGCQWSTAGDIVNIGSTPNCRAAHGREYGPSIPDVVEQLPSLLSRSLWILLAIVAGVVLLRFGGAVVVRFLLPAILVGLATFMLIRYGKKQSWW